MPTQVVVGRIQSFRVPGDHSFGVVLHRLIVIVGQCECQTATRASVPVLLGFPEFLCHRYSSCMSAYFADLMLCVSHFVVLCKCPPV